MSRLRKIALIGNIKKNDIKFVQQDNFINVELVNEEKIVHEGDGEGQYANFVDNIIATMAFYQEENNNDIILTIDVVEVRDEYKQSMVLKYLLDYFNDNVLEDYIQQYGKDRVYLSATFENEDLADMILRVTRKKGIKWDTSASVNDNIFLDDAEDIIHSYGLTFESDDVDSLIVINSPIKNGFQLFERLNSSNRREDVEYLHGCITYDGDVLYSYKQQLIQDYEGIHFVWENNYVDIDADLEEFYDISYYGNIYPTLGDSTIVFNDMRYDNVMDLLEDIEENTSITASKIRLKKVYLDERFS